MRASGTDRRDKDPGVHRCDPRDSVWESSIALDRKNKAKVAIFSSTKSGGYSGSIGLDFVGKEPNGVIHGLAIDLGQHRVLKVTVLESGKVARQHGWSRLKITKLCNY